MGNSNVNWSTQNNRSEITGVSLIRANKSQNQQKTIDNPETKEVENYLIGTQCILQQSFKICKKTNQTISKCFCQQIKKQVIQYNLLTKIPAYLKRINTIIKEFQQLKKKQNNQNIRLKLVCYEEKNKEKQNIKTRSYSQQQLIPPNISQTLKKSYQIVQLALKDYLKPLKFELLTILNSKKQYYQINLKKQIHDSHNFLILSQINKEQYVGCHFIKDNKVKCITKIVYFNLEKEPSVIAKRQSKFIKLQQGQLNVGRNQFIINKYGNIMKIDLHENSQQHEFKVAKMCRILKSIHPIKKIQIYKID